MVTIYITFVFNIIYLTVSYITSFADSCVEQLLSKIL